jgi:hypothetical protein
MMMQPTRSRSLRELLDNNDLPPEELSDYQQLIAHSHRLTSQWKDSDIEWRTFGGPPQNRSRAMHSTHNS